jgi:hypothetical protein
LKEVAEEWKQLFDIGFEKRLAKWIGMKDEILVDWEGVQWAFSRHISMIRGQDDRRYDPGITLAF